MITVMNPEYFYVVTPPWTGSRLYKVFVTEDAFCFARMPGPRRVPDSQEWWSQQAMADGTLFGVFFGWLRDRALAERMNAEKLYETMDVSSSHFLTLDSRNFRLSPNTIKRVEINMRGPWWMEHPGAARLEFQMWDNSRKRFVVVEGQDMKYVQRHIAKLVSNIQVTA